MTTLPVSPLAARKRPLRAKGGRLGQGLCQAASGVWPDEPTNTGRAIDAAQNLAKRTNNTTVKTFTVNALNQLTGIPDSTPSYDRRGNLVSRAFSSGLWAYLSYTYDHENRLTGVQTDTDVTEETYRFTVELAYDGAGRLRRKRDYVWYYDQWYLSAETRYLYDGLLLVQERTGANTPAVTYTRGQDLSGTLDGAGGIGGLLARSHGYSSGNWTSHNFYHADGNGNVTALASSGGTLQASYLYDPYGRYLAGGGVLAGANTMRFSSKPWIAFADLATEGLYSYGYRFYDPYLQRWVNRDPIHDEGFTAQSPPLIPVRNDQTFHNLYRFSVNDPANQVDPHGLHEERFGPPILVPQTPPSPSTTPMICPAPPPPPCVLMPTPGFIGAPAAGAARGLAESGDRIARTLNLKELEKAQRDCGPRCLNKQRCCIIHIKYSYNPIQPVILSAKGTLVNKPCSQIASSFISDGTYPSITIKEPW